MRGKGREGQRKRESREKEEGMEGERGTDVEGEREKDREEGETNKVRENKCYSILVLTKHCFI